MLDTCEGPGGRAQRRAPERQGLEKVGLKLSSDVLQQSVLSCMYVCPNFYGCRIVKGLGSPVLLSFRMIGTMRMIRKERKSGTTEHKQTSTKSLAAAIEVTTSKEVDTVVRETTRDRYAQPYSLVLAPYGVSSRI